MDHFMKRASVCCSFLFVWVVVLLLLSSGMQAQQKPTAPIIAKVGAYAGIGGLLVFPSGDLAKDKNPAYGGEASIAFPMFYELWPLIRISYVPFDYKESVAAAQAECEGLLAFGVRLHPIRASRSFPLHPYIDLVSTVSVVKVKDEATPLGWGWQAGAGFMVPYGSCDWGWYFDLFGRYGISNNFLRGAGRPILPTFTAGLSINVAI